MIAALILLAGVGGLIAWRCRPYRVKYDQWPKGDPAKWPTKKRRSF